MPEMSHHLFQYHSPPSLLSTPLRLLNFNLQASLNRFKNRHRATKPIPIVDLLDCHRAINTDHIRGRLGAQSPQVHIARALLDADHVLLAALGGQAGLGIVVEEGVKAGAVDEDGA